MKIELTDEAKARVLHVVDYAFDTPELVDTLQNSVELHVFAVNWNWDNASFEPLRRLIRDPRCDKGTALLVYWYGEPSYFYEKIAKHETLEDYEM